MTQGTYEALSENGTLEKDMPYFVSQKFGRHAGIAQQYLYYYYAIGKNDK